MMKRTAAMGLVVWIGAAVLPGCAPSAEQLTTEGISLYQVGKLEPAKGRLQRVLATEPSYADALFHMGRVYQAQKFHEMAIYYYQCTLDAAPGHGEAGRYLAMAQREAGLAGPKLRFLPDAPKEP